MIRPQFDLWTLGLATIIVSIFSSVSGQQLCSTQQTINGAQKVFSNCRSLPTQSASIAWSLDQTTNRLNISFSGQGLSSSGWVGWGLNPTGLTMEGTRALIGFRDNQGNITMPEYDLTLAVKNQLTTLSPGATDLGVLDKAIEISQTTFHMYASLQLKPNQTTVNLIWNRGPGVNGNTPQAHSTAPADLQGTSSIDLSSGIVSGGGTAPHQHLKNTHGVLAAISWGVLLPLGAMAARYLRAFDPAWFYIHGAIQCTGYILGVSAWGIGLRLGHYSQSVVYHQHRRIGITLFCFATLQVLAIALRPTKEAKIRIYWNVYHHVVGYTTIVLAAINIFKGLDILQPGSGWRTAYIVIISTLGGVSIILEIITWSLFFRKRKQTSNKPYGNGGSYRVSQDATNGNGHTQGRHMV